MTGPITGLRAWKPSSISHGHGSHRRAAMVPDVSLTLSIHIFSILPLLHLPMTVSCKISFVIMLCLDEWLNHCNLQCFTIVKSSSCSFSLSDGLHHGFVCYMKFSYESTSASLQVIYQCFVAGNPPMLCCR